MCSCKIISADVCIYKTIMTLKLWVHVKYSIVNILDRYNYIKLNKRTSIIPPVVQCVLLQKPYRT